MGILLLVPSDEAVLQRNQLVAPRYHFPPEASPLGKTSSLRGPAAVSIQIEDSGGVPGENLVLRLFIHA